jgi:hypothetical protein
LYAIGGKLGDLLYAFPAFLDTRHCLKREFAELTSHHGDTACNLIS